MMWPQQKLRSETGVGIGQELTLAFKVGSVKWATGYFLLLSMGTCIIEFFKWKDSVFFL